MGGCALYGPFFISTITFPPCLPHLTFQQRSLHTLFIPYKHWGSDPKTINVKPAKPIRGPEEALGVAAMGAWRADARGAVPNPKAAELQGCSSLFEGLGFRCIRLKDVLGCRAVLKSCYKDLDAREP